MLEDRASPAALVSDVIVIPEGLLISTCCEPASGERWKMPWDGEITSLGFGQTVDAADEIVVSVDANGMFVRLDQPGADPLVLTSASGQMPVDAAISPDGKVLVVVSLGEGDVVNVYVVDPRSHTEFDMNDPVTTSAQLGGQPAIPALDSHGRVWLLVRDRANETVLAQVTIDLVTGSIQEIELNLDPLDQEFDKTGTFLIMTDGLGAVWWHSIDGEDGNIEGLPPMDRIDW